VTDRLSSSIAGKIENAPWNRSADCDWSLPNRKEAHSVR
jgi:hypothetical protein